MTEVEIPFMDRFEADMLLGRKWWATRSRKYGEVGDVFKKWGATFQLIAVVPIELEVVAKYGYRQEGFFSPADFEQCWVELHSKLGWTPKATQWVHMLRRLE